MQSEAASESSLATGPDKSGRRSKSPRRAAAFEVTFESQRMRHLSWALFHFAFGGLLVVALGTVAKAIGAFFLLLGVLRAVKFARRGLGPEATITVTADSAKLPEKMTTAPGDRDVHDIDGIASVFYLRRSIPWFRISPVLVIESAGSASSPGKVYRFPRDWFASDADQRRVADALTARMGRQLPQSLVTPLEPEDAPADSAAVSRRNQALGFFIASGVLVMIGNLGLAEFLARASLPTSLVYVASGLCFVTGAYFLLFLPEKTEASDEGNKPSGKPSKTGRGAKSRSGGS